MNQINLDNIELTKNFLQRQFFNGWKNKLWKSDDKYVNSSSLELQAGAVCDLKCKYCYYAKFHKDLYPPEISKRSLILNNLDILLNWLEKNSYYPKIEIFSGEFFNLSYGLEFLEKVINWQIKNNHLEPIVVPTNMSFIFDDEKIKNIEKILKYASENNIRIFLSASVDGKYCDANRPFIKEGKIRDDIYYEKVFEFAKKYNVGFHPMIYSENIEKWIDNFKWFMDMFCNYGMPLTSLYLLEVRNKEWSKEQLRAFYKFIRFVVNWSINRIINDVPKQDIPKFIFDNKFFNIFNTFFYIGRGIGCSIQSTIQLRIGDLTASVCHRASYKTHNLWKFKVKDNEIVDIESLNHNLLITAFSSDTRNFPMCECCPIRELCNGQCLGSMYEAHGELFLPIPTVCALEHAKVSAILDEIIDLNLYDEFYEFTDKRNSLNLYKKYFRRD